MDEITEWQCEDCGIIHTHRQTLHTLWDVISWEHVKKLTYNPNCNCGFHEAALRDDIDFDHPRQRAPVPKKVEQEIEEKFA